MVSDKSSSPLLVIIPARGGSKGLPRKNIRQLAGKPLIAWTIEAALRSQVPSRVVLSTDDPEILNVGLQWGAEAPFLRPIELAQDQSGSVDVILHAVHWLADNENYLPEYVMFLQPTSPLRSSEDIQQAVRLIRDKQADAVVSVNPVHQHPYWMKTISTDGRLVNFLSTERPYTSRQDLPPTYALNGAIYLIKRDVFLAQRSLNVENTLAYVMPSERSLDIDTPWDFHLAELVLKDKLQHEHD
jgi:N-acylneuraminate cytidylyltransferase/CMP-N,N'-diacetyllegionaminic acid synthase